MDNNNIPEFANKILLTMLDKNLIELHHRGQIIEHIETPEALEEYNQCAVNQVMKVYGHILQELKKVEN